MKTKGYRIFLIFLLIVTIGAGVLYCYNMYQKKDAPKGGTLVKNYSIKSTKTWV